MIHYTLNTGHSRTSLRSEIAADVLRKMQPFIVPGEHFLAKWTQDFAGYRLVAPVTPAGFVATLYRGEAPLLTLGVAATDADADVVWPSIESLYLKVAELPVMRSADFQASHRPTALPWLAVVLVAPHLCPEWSGDFERCLAHTYLAFSDS